jgi:hypothetical protein
MASSVRRNLVAAVDKVPVLGVRLTVSQRDAATRAASRLRSGSYPGSQE